jgi:ketosteroid isomerase-like protein
MTTGDDRDLQKVRAAYAAFAASEIDAAVANIADDVEWIEPDEFPDGGPHHGRAAVRRYLERSRASWRELTSMPTAADFRLAFSPAAVSSDRAS